MKYILILSTFLLLSIVTKSQIVFNKIIENNTAYITGSVVAVDTGYVFLSGTNNENLTRCFALTYVDNNGNKIWSKIKDDTEFELWEGYNNCFKECSSKYNMTGLARSTMNDTNFIYIYKYNSLFEIEDSIKIKDDTLFKRAFNQIVTPDSSYYIVGQTYNYSLEKYELLLVKLDSNKNIIWDKTYGDRYEAGFQIIETSDNNILIGGLTFSFPTSITDEDWYLLKVDTAGNVLWEKGLGNGSLYDGGVAGIIETQDSNYIACGGYPAFEAGGNSYFDGCLRKVSRNGELIWTKFYRNYSINPTSLIQYTDFHINEIVQLPNGDFGIVGSCYWYYTILRGFLMVTDSSGRIKWHKYYFAEDYTSSWQYLKTLKPTNDKGFILAGYGNEYDDFGYDPPQQAWLVKTDSLGLDGLCYTEAPELNIDIELPETICTNDTIEVYAYIAGKSAPYTIGFSTGQIIDSIFYPPLFVPIEIGLSQTSVVVGDSEYYSEQITEATLSNHEWGQCIAKPVEFYTPLTPGSQEINITVTDAYGESKTITKTFNVQNCDDNIVSENVCPVKLYPNPAKDKVYIDIPVTSTYFDSAQHKSLSHLENKTEIYNSSGQIVKTTNVHKGLNVVNVSELASGTYIVKISTEDGTFSLSFEKE